MFLYLCMKYKTIGAKRVIGFIVNIIYYNSKTLLNNLPILKIVQNFLVSKYCIIITKFTKNFNYFLFNYINKLMSQNGKENTGLDDKIFSTVNIGNLE